MEDDLEEFRLMFQEMGWMAVFIAGITPIPFKVAAILAGAAGMNLAAFIGAAMASRLLRFALMGAMIALFGKLLHRLVERHSKPFLAACMIVVVGGFLLLPMIDPGRSSRPRPCPLFGDRFLVGSFDDDLARGEGSMPELEQPARRRVERREGAGAVAGRAPGRWPRFRTSSPAHG